MKCQNLVEGELCGAELIPSAKFCSNCGSKAQNKEEDSVSVPCPKCTLLVTRRQKFCAGCGLKIDPSIFESKKIVCAGTKDDGTKCDEELLPHMKFCVTCGTVQNTPAAELKAKGLQHVSEVKVDPVMKDKQLRHPTNVNDTSDSSSSSWSDSSDKWKPPSTLSSIHESNDVENVIESKESRQHQQQEETQTAAGVTDDRTSSDKFLNSAPHQDVVMRLKLELEQVTRRMSFLEKENEGMKKRIEKLEVTNEALVENIEFTTDSSDEAHKWKSVNDQVASNATLSQRKKKRLLLSGEPVAFTAVLTHGVTLGPLQTIEYNKVITNIGNGYDVRHGYFTSPVKGIYLFSATICSPSNKAVRTEMMVNGKQIAAMYGDHYDLGSHTVVAVLEQNDQAWIRHFNEGTSSVHSGGDRYYSSFSGVLIHSLQ